jgi:hypothetical protein
MKQFYKISVLITAGVFLVVLSLKAQKDTTELKVGKKKLMIVDEKTRKENAVYNLEKAKESFEKEIIVAQELIKKKEELIQQQKELIKQKEELLKQREELLKEKEKALNEASVSALNSERFYIQNIDGLSEKEIADSIKNEIKKELSINESEEKDLDKLIEERTKMFLYEKELKKLKAEIEKEKIEVELNRKKEEVFRDGIADLDREIADIEEDMSELNKKLNNDHKVNYHKELNLNHVNRSTFNAHWAGFELGILNFVNARGVLASDRDLDYLVLIPEKTMLYGLNILEYDLALSKNRRFGAATGAGLEWNSIALKQNINLFEDENGVIRAEYVDPDVTDYIKNKLNAVYVTVPLMLEYQIPIKHRKFYVAAGVTGGIRAWSKQKQKFEKDGQVYKNKKVDNFQLAPFRYGAMAAIGYGDIGLFLKYNFIPLFKEEAGPELYPISVGLKIIDF